MVHYTFKLTFKYVQKDIIELDSKGMINKFKRLYDHLYNRA